MSVETAHFTLIETSKYFLKTNHMRHYQPVGDTDIRD